jgi:hypothetical protein
VDAGTHFVVDGDMMIRKDRIRPTGRSGGLKPRYQYSATTTAQSGAISVDLSAVEAVDPSWASAFRAAMAEWNVLPGADMGMIEHTDPYDTPDVVARFGPCDGRATTIACADFPYVGDYGSRQSGSFVEITHNFDWYGPDRKLYTLVHELGHVLGLRHTNWRANGESASPRGAVKIPGTNETDAVSVMNATIQDWNGFSYYDRVAARYLWPGGKGPIANAGMSGANPSISWQPMQDAISYEVYYRSYEMEYSPIYGQWPAVRDHLVGTTTGTSVVDGSRSFSSPSACYDFWPTGYYVVAVFPNSRTMGGSMACYQ